MRVGEWLLLMVTWYVEDAMIRRVGMMTSSVTPGDVWDAIERLEDARRELYAREKQANAETRWWLLLPMALLCIPLALSTSILAYTLAHYQSLSGIIVGVAGCAVIVTALVFLVRRLLASRRAGLARRRELRAEIAGLKHELDRLRSGEPVSGLAGGRSSEEELTERLETCRDELVDLTLAPHRQARLRYVVAAYFTAGAAVLVILVGMAFPLSAGKYYGLLGVGIPLLVLSGWGLVRLTKKLDEPRILVAPRREQLKRVIARLEDELRRRRGRAALRRQPATHAQVAWRGFAPYTPAPAEVLRRLPVSSSRLRFWFHRHVGWGVVAGALYIVAALLLYMSLS